MGCGACRYATALVEARKKKGMTRSSAIDQLKDVNYFGTMMVKCGDADGMVSGAVHTTAATIRPGLQARPRALQSRRGCSLWHPITSPNNF